MNDTWQQAVNDQCPLPEEAGPEHWQLRLYVAGKTPKCLGAYARLKKLCEEYLPGRYEIEVIDLLEQPHLAESDEIIAVPTLIRKLPTPLRKVVGDLADLERTLLGLQIRREAP